VLLAKVLLAKVLLAKVLLAKVLLVELLLVKVLLDKVLLAKMLLIKVLLVNVLLAMRDKSPTYKPDSVIREKSAMCFCSCSFNSITCVRFLENSSLNYEIY